MREGGREVGGEYLCLRRPRAWVNPERCNRGEFSYSEPLYFKCQELHACFRDSVTSCGEMTNAWGESRLCAIDALNNVAKSAKVLR